MDSGNPADAAVAQAAASPKEAEPVTNGKTRKKNKAPRSTFGEIKTMVVRDAQRAQYPLCILIAHLCCLMLALFTFDAGIVAIRGLVHRDTTLEFAHQRAHAQLLENANLLDGKRDALLTRSLHKRFFETHAQCLARAANDAHYHYRSLPYEAIQDIVDDTIAWAELECSKLMFTPDVPRHSRHILYRTWVVVVDTAEKSFFHLRDVVVGWFNKKLARADSRHRRVRVFSPSQSQRKKPSNKSKPRALYLLPPNYEINCEHGPVCLLSSKAYSRYSTTSDYCPPPNAPNSGRLNRSLKMIEDGCVKVSTWTWEVQRRLLGPLQVLTGCILASVIAINIRASYTSDHANTCNLFKSLCAVFGTFLTKSLLVRIHAQYRTSAVKYQGSAVMAHMVWISWFFLPLMVAFRLRSTFDHSFRWALRELGSILHDLRSTLREIHCILHTKINTCAENLKSTGTKTTARKDASDDNTEAEDSDKISDGLADGHLEEPPRSAFGISTAPPDSDNTENQIVGSTRMEGADQDTLDQSDAESSWYVVTPPEQDGDELMELGEPRNGGTEVVESIEDSGHNEIGGIGEIADDPDDDHLLSYKCGICQEVKFEAMIRCDNFKCPQQWFHLECVGLHDDILPEDNATWFCPECTEQSA